MEFPASERIPASQDLISKGYVRSESLSSTLPMYERRKLTMSTTCSIAGTTSSSRHIFASGHLDMICASSGTRPVRFDLASVDWVVIVSGVACG